MNNKLLDNGNLIKGIRYAGLALALIFCLYILWNLVGNHLNRNTEVLIGVEKSMDKLNEASVQQTEVLRGLKTLIETKL